MRAPDVDVLRSFGFRPPLGEDVSLRAVDFSLRRELSKDDDLVLLEVFTLGAVSLALSALVVQHAHWFKESRPDATRVCQKRLRSEHRIKVALSSM